MSCAKKSVKISCFAAVAAIAVVFSFFASGATLAYNVNYDGKVIATVKNKREVESAIRIVLDSVSGINVEKALCKPQCSAVIVLGSGIDGKQVVADAIIENSESIVKGSALYVDGKQVATVRDNLLDGYIDEYCSRFSVDAECTMEFVEEVETEEGYYLSDEFDSYEDVQEILSSLSVKTVANVVTDTRLPYKTVTNKTRELMIGETKVVTPGAEGLHQKTECVTYINGVEQTRTLVSDVTVSQPVNRVVLTGTAKTQASASQISVAHNSGFIFPLPNGTWKVSSYYGDGRNHKGVDICAAKGTPIFAVKSGVVIESAWHGGFGYCVRVDHGNGLVSLYAHASKLCVSKGDRVNAGDVVALVGSTGNSYGNHLHFSVLSNGSYRDPAPYIGLD